MQKSSVFHEDVFYESRVLTIGRPLSSVSRAVRTHAFGSGAASVRAQASNEYAKANGLCVTT